MADLSFSFDPAGISDAISKCAVNSNTASVVSAAAVAATSKASAASVAAAAASTAAASATSTATVALSAASDATSAASDAASIATGAQTKANSLASTVIRSLPGSASRAVHQIIYTSAGLVKFKYSSVAS